MITSNTYELDINNRAFKAIKAKTKKVEIRVTKINNEFDYSILKKDDIIILRNDDGESQKCKIIKVNWYQTIEELLTIEGTEYTLSSTNDFNEGVKSINSIPGYTAGMKKNGVYAIHLEPVVEN